MSEEGKSNAQPAHVKTGRKRKEGKRTRQNRTELSRTRRTADGSCPFKTVTSVRPSNCIITSCLTSDVQKGKKNLPQFKARMIYDGIRGHGLFSKSVGLGRERTGVVRRILVILMFGLSRAVFVSLSLKQCHKTPHGIRYSTEGLSSDQEATELQEVRAIACV